MNVPKKPILFFDFECDSTSYPGSGSTFTDPSASSAKLNHWVSATSYSESIVCSTQSKVVVSRQYPLGWVAQHGQQANTPCRYTFSGHSLIPELTYHTFFP